MTNKVWSPEKTIRMMRAANKLESYAYVHAAYRLDAEDGRKAAAAHDKWLRLSGTALGTMAFFVREGAYGPQVHT